MNRRVLVLFSLVAMMLAPMNFNMAPATASASSVKVVVASVPDTASPLYAVSAPTQVDVAPELSFTWKNTPLIEIDDAVVDIGVGFDPDCLNGPIAVTVLAGSMPRLIMDGPTPEFVWSLGVKDGLEVTNDHIALEVTAVFPGKRSCRKDEVALAITPKNPRFVAARERGDYDKPGVFVSS